MEIHFLPDTLVKNKEIARSDFTSILCHHLVTFWHDFRALFHDFPYFFGTDFRMHFWVCFSKLLAPNWLPNGSQNRPRNSKKTKMLSTIPAQAAWPLFGHKFGSILVAIWDVLGIFWSPFGRFREHFGKNHLLETSCNLYQRNI